MSQISADGVESLTDALLQPMGARGVFARTAVFEAVIGGLMDLITRHREPDMEILRFPPVMSRSILQTSGYLKSFPHLLGSVSSLHGTEADIHALVAGRADGRKWTDALAPTDLVLTPAACYPLYPLVASRGAVRAPGELFDVEAYCFRREASAEIGRLQSFRMREYVCIGTPQHVLDFRTRWITRAEQLANQLALPHRLAPASDPFFGRVGKLMAINQVDQALKFELLVPLGANDGETACMSFNYHQDHFGTTWGLRTDGDEIAHTACAAFGLERLGLVLFSTHGHDVRAWPADAREALSL